MGYLPASAETLIEQYGPHLQYEPPGGFAARTAPDRKVQTHCCFCGQQCGVTLLVKNEQVIGVEPWEEFPFNQGKLCPKGVKRYLQNNHPDRLRYPLVRSGHGFERISWDEALDQIAERFQRLQAHYGPDSVGVLSGASLTNEKAYLMGKFARVGLGTRHIDYNGRLCMVAAGAANLKAFGLDRAANPWADIANTDLILVTGSNVSECSPITVDYIWRARDRGAKLIVIDPRLTPIARTADLYLPVKPGRDSALMNAILHAVIRLGGVDHDFVAAHTDGFDAVRDTVADYSPESMEQLVGIPAARIRQAAAMWTQAPRTMLLHARGIEHHTKGVDNVLSCINLVLATGKIGKPGCGYATITGQGNGQGAREHGQRCNQLPGARDIENPEHRQHIADFWGIDERELPQKGATAPEIIEMAHRREIRGLLSLCFNPIVSLPDSAFTREALERLDCYVVIDFFMSETARHADIILPGSLQEEDEGTVTSTEGRVIRIRQAVNPPAEARRDWNIICDLGRRLGKGQYFDFNSAGEIFDELRRASHGGKADYFGISYEKIERQMGVFWPCPTAAHPGTPRLFEGGQFAHPDGRARFHAIEYRPPAEDTDDEYPILLTTGRVVSQFLSGTQTRRIGPLVDQCPQPYVEMHPRLADQLGIRDGAPVHVISRRGEVTLPALVVATIRPDTIFIPYHWPGDQSANRLTQRAYDPIAKIPEFKVSAVRVERALA
ncbi:MAG: molybdopterin oxidoreductase family protein [Deltaproteobacteria bacterium]|nr:molybdopterin oxidoreductase family protein [Deltaproteobacteria bacterium]MBI3389561.1 molybdopterin oxidoreductase family protein [Deltaproteobacteria bacterium]